METASLWPSVTDSMVYDRLYGISMYGLGGPSKGGKHSTYIPLRILQCVCQRCACVEHSIQKAVFGVPLQDHLQHTGGEISVVVEPVSYTHLTLPTIYSV